MFTGIVAATGIIDTLERVDGDLRAAITANDMDLGDVAIGDSICVSGVCLTAIAVDGDTFTVDISNETVSLTSFANLAAGDRVNLEKAMQPSSRFGGHIVSGHVDGLAVLITRHPDARSERLTFEAPAHLAKYIAAKGSVCLEGISLTVNDVDGSRFGINIIPHTAEHTTIGEMLPGDRVNLEVDIISRYLERLLDERGANADVEGITTEKLVRSGFAGKSH